MSLPPPQKLHVTKALLGAVVMTWHHRRAFAQALSVPMLCIVILMVVWYQTYTSLPEEFTWIVWGCYAFLFVLVAVLCHRIMLLDQPVENAWMFPKWTWRETRFLGCGALVWAAAMLIFLLAMTVAGIIGANLPGSTEANQVERQQYVGYAAKLAYWYIFARLCLVFPAIAIDEEVNLSQAWNRSRGNGWRLFVAICVMPFCLSHLLGYMQRAEPSLLEYLLLTGLGTMLIAVEVAALSLSYRQLANWQLPEPS